MLAVHDYFKTRRWVDQIDAGITQVVYMEIVQGLRKKFTTRCIHDDHGDGLVLDISFKKFILT